jgi:ABC-type transport system involved in Fe-S cluster assembly fused permease/ATPase subunit
MRGLIILIFEMDSKILYRHRRPFHWLTAAQSRCRGRLSVLASLAAVIFSRTSGRLMARLISRFSSGTITLDTAVNYNHMF